MKGNALPGAILRASIYTRLANSEKSMGRRYFFLFFQGLYYDAEGRVTSTKKGGHQCVPL